MDTKRCGRHRQLLMLYSRYEVKKNFFARNSLTIQNFDPEREKKKMLLMVNEVEELGLRCFCLFYLLLLLLRLRSVIIICTVGVEGEDADGARRLSPCVMRGLVAKSSRLLPFPWAGRPASLEVFNLLLGRKNLCLTRSF